MWCDTDFAKGTKMTVAEIVDRVGGLVGGGDEELFERTHHDLLGRQEGRLIVISGGEPCLQLERELVIGLHEDGWEVAVETNGTIENPALEIVDHVTVSPKLQANGELELAVLEADELKVVLPGVAPGSSDPGWTDQQLVVLARRGTWGHLYVQPMDPPTGPGTGETALHALTTAVHAPVIETMFAAVQQYQRNVDRCIEFVKAHPAWRLSTQTHKFANIP